MKFLLILAALLPLHPQAAGEKHLTLSAEGLQLILDHEVGGGAPYYNRHLIRPTWPGGASGVTIGVGYDLGHNTRGDIARDWSALPPATLRQLQACAGITGASARLRLPAVRHILIPWESALRVYRQRTIPRFAADTRTAYPGVHTLHPHIQSALLSWVFNRGPGIHPTSGRDREKRAIRSAIPARPSALPPQFRSSKRLWTSTNLTGLIRRREAEAALIEQGLLMDPPTTHQ
ncbi:hypothetical protein OVA24_17040 [Luteolibacter sp. SL250]|uniref:hypothetical protein n=1 Tax=Luteolibacter sp. SL250 TaxID=2995170 RepID=UPI00226F30F8|nr:hypothetical protein [Luteolibacter sp. SL250]WAC18940.1 hypothetical protein OVA24_17040 [Luteolibacter sp. SL250]